MKKLLIANCTRAFSIILAIICASPAIAAPGLVGSVTFEQISFTANHSGSVPCSEYGHVEFTVIPDPSAVGYTQIMADLPTGSPAWVVRNLPVLDASTAGASTFPLSTTIDLIQLGVSRGSCISGTNVDFNVTFTATPIDIAPLFSPTLSGTIGSRTNNAEGDIPVTPFFPGSLAASLPPPSFVFVPGPEIKVGRPGMGSVEQGDNECGPGGVANSMHWLASTGAINLGGDTPSQSLEKLKSDMKPGGWTGNGVSQKEAVEGKLRFAQRPEHPLDIEIRYQGDLGLTDLGASVTVGGMTANRDGTGGPPDWAFLKKQMQEGEDVELSLDWLDNAGNKTGGHVVVVSGLIERGNHREILFNDDNNQGAAGGLRTNHSAKIEDEGGYMKLGGQPRNRIKAIYAESPKKKPTLISLLSFTTVAGDGQVSLRWTTGSEIDNEGFNILRSESPDGLFVRINQAMIPAKAISPGGATYSFEDMSIVNGITYYYKLEEIDIKANRKQYGPVAAVKKNIEDETTDADVSLNTSGQNSKDRTTKEVPVTSEENKENGSNYKEPISIYTIVANADAPAKFLSGEVVDKETVHGIIINTKATIEKIEGELEIREKESETDLSGDTLSRRTDNTKITVVEKYVSSLPSILFRIVDPEGYELAVASIDPNSEGSVFGKNAKAKSKNVTLQKRWDKEDIILTWDATEPVKGFHILRSTKKDGSYQKITKTPIPYIGSDIDGQFFRYTYTDRNVKEGKNYYYKLEVIHKEGQIAFR